MNTSIFSYIYTHNKKTITFSFLLEAHCLSPEQPITLCWLPEINMSSLSPVICSASGTHGRRRDFWLTSTPMYYYDREIKHFHSPHALPAQHLPQEKPRFMVLSSLALELAEPTLGSTLAVSRRPSRSQCGAGMAMLGPPGPLSLPPRGFQRTPSLVSLFLLLQSLHGRRQGGDRCSHCPSVNRRVKCHEAGTVEPVVTQIFAPASWPSMFSVVRTAGATVAPAPAHHRSESIQLVLPGSSVLLDRGLQMRTPVPASTTSLAP